MQGLLSTRPPGQGERKLALGMVLACTAVFAALAPFAAAPLAPVPAFVAASQSALAVGSILTAALLAGQARIAGSRALLVLACGYLFSAAMAIIHLLVVPGLFEAGGLFGAVQQASAWLFLFWHGGFPAFVVAYALMQRAGHRPAARRPVAFVPGLLLVAVAVLGSSLIALPAQSLLPRLVDHHGHTPAMLGTAAAGGLLCLVALAILWRRRDRSVLDCWLPVVLVAWMFGIALAALLNAGRYDLGFYAGGLYGLLSALVLPGVLLLDNARAHEELARAAAGEREHRMRAETLARQLDEVNAYLEARVSGRTAALEAANRELQEVAHVGATAREQERTRVARELRDELAQRLTAVKMDVAWLGANPLAADPATRSRLAGMQQLLDGSVATTRRLAAEMRPLMLDDLGFNAAAEWLVEGFTQRTRIPCRFTIFPPDLDLPEPAATAVFRILQEGLANIARHSSASGAEVELRGFADEVFLRVGDNGSGFDPTQPRKPGSFGLVGVREHVHLVGGRLRIDSRAGRGTTIEVWVPLPAQH